MRKFLLPGLGALVLVGCAPAYSGVPSRLVNLSTGQEGSVTFDRRPIYYGSGSVVVRFGEETLTGVYNVLGNNNTGPRLGIGLGFGFGGGFFYGPRASISAGYDGFGYDPFGYGGYNNNAPRAGNFIVRGAGNRTISCDFLTDSYGRGNGDCTDGQGQKYTLQF